MDCYLCFDENRIIWGTFESEEEAKFYADVINKDPDLDTIIKVRKYAIMPKGYSKELLKNIALQMLENYKKVQND